MVIEEKNAGQMRCAANPSRECAGRACMAWGELPQARGWCTRCTMPPEAVSELTREMMKSLPRILRLFETLH